MTEYYLNPVCNPNHGSYIQYAIVLDFCIIRETIYVQYDKQILIIEAV